MAWAVSNNAWADRVDGEEDTAPPPLFGGAPAPALQESAFPSLGDAAAMPQPTKKEKKKGGKPAKMSLADFNSGAYKPPVQASGPSYGSRRRAEMRDEDIMSMLPKGPAGYSAEDQGGNRLGGGFKGYGGDRGGESYLFVDGEWRGDVFCLTTRAAVPVFPFQLPRTHDMVYQGALSSGSLSYSSMSTCHFGKYCILPRDT